MAQVDLTKCSEVAKRELAYLHDHQMLMQELVKLLGGQRHFIEVVVPKLTREVKLSSDYLEQVN